MIAGPDESSENLCKRNEDVDSVLRRKYNPAFLPTIPAATIAIFKNRKLKNKDENA